MATIKRFEEIEAWEVSRELCDKLSSIIEAGSFRNSYKLIGQIEGSAGSIMDNIAEGFERGGNKEFIQFLYIAKGSCGEIRSQLYRAIDRNYITMAEFDDLSVHAVKISAMIQKLITYLENTPKKGIKYK